jgi:hypothetical protein
LNSRLQKNSSTRKPNHRDPEPGNPKKLATAYDEQLRALNAGGRRRSQETKRNNE